MSAARATGERTGTLALPAEVTTPSGLALTGDRRAMISTTAGEVFVLSGVPGE